MLYTKFFKKILFLLEAEKAHKITLKSLKILDKLGILGLLNSFNFFNKNNKKTNYSLKLLNLDFPNRIGLAAGLDKNGEYLSALSKLGFGFIEIGTVTPRPQGGNPKPRLFRLKKHSAIINRMGFNNLGIDNLINNVRNFKKNKSNNIILGINIGKNFDTPIEPIDLAVQDYIICLEKAYIYSDYIAVNISSPNTENLRLLQKADYLDVLLSKIKNKQLELNNKYDKYTPLALKIAPDLTIEEVNNIGNLCIKYNIDILIATNTTNNHELLFDKNNNKIAGGLSGQPLFSRSNIILQQIINKFTENNYRDKIIIIAVGGINSAADAKVKFDLGADLVQIYSGLVYQGLSLVKDCQYL